MSAATEENRSSAEILDEIFREIKEKTAAGEINLGIADLTRLISQSKAVLSDSDFESPVEVEKKHVKTKKHRHKHKKHHKRKHRQKEKAVIKREVSVEWIEVEKRTKGEAAGGTVEESEPANTTGSGIADEEGKLKTQNVETNDKTDKKSESSVACNSSVRCADAAEVVSAKSCADDTNRPKRSLGQDVECRTEAKRVKRDVSLMANENLSIKVGNVEGGRVSDVEEGEVNDKKESLIVKARSSSTFASSGDSRRSKHRHSRSSTSKSTIVCAEETVDSVKTKKKKKKKTATTTKKKYKRFTSPLMVTPVPHRDRRVRSASYSSSASSTSPKWRGSRSSRLRRRSPPRTRSPTPVEKIDKAMLLEVARKNAMAMMAEGKMPPGLSLGPLKHEQVVAIKSGGKSVAELTDFCKLLSKKESENGELSDDSSKRKSDDEDRSTFLHHPFKLRDPQPNIIMKIRNAVQIPVKTQAEKVAESSKLRIQFPVSSGTQHRQKESEWVPVSPGKEQVSTSTNLAAFDAATTDQSQQEQQQQSHAVAVVDEKVFQEESPNGLQPDIGSIVSQRLNAVRKLMENPHDAEALGQMYKSQQEVVQNFYVEMQHWAQSKQLPGQFTGTTDVTLLTPQQLAGPAHVQAWVRKGVAIAIGQDEVSCPGASPCLAERDDHLTDQFSRATPVQSRFGMQMLQKMGWKPGEGLGKNKEGVAEPLILDIKMDKKGLVSQDEVVRRNNVPPVVKDLSGKHPVSALVELCTKRKWFPPEFTMIHDSGPDHRKNFLFKVRVNGCEYQPTITSLTKKHAKMQCATACLQALGLIPRNLQIPV